MRPDLLLEHLSQATMGRRTVLRAAAGLGAAGALASLGLPLEAEGEPAHGRPPAPPAGDFNDDMFDVAAVKAGAWDATAFYGKGDQRGTFNEVTPEKTERALRRLRPGRPVKTYNLGDVMFNGYPAFPGTPPRLYEQRLYVLGYQPRSEFKGIVAAPAAAGPNLLSLHEERFEVPKALLEANAPYTGTYQIGTQLDNLNHVGVGDVFYGGHRGADIAETWGTNKLGAEHMGPIVTRGVVIDVLGLKLSQGKTDDLSTAGNGKPILRDDYRITVEDIEAAMRRQRTARIEAGDVVLFRTGWNQLVEPRDPTSADAPHASGDPVHPSHPDHKRYLAGEPGIYLREARYLAARRPAIIGGDAWGLEVRPGPDDSLFPAHQELLGYYGIRIGEAVITDPLVADDIYDFVYVITPPNALGATGGNTPPAALAQPG
jgi:kynurenine formamidase